MNSDDDKSLRPTVVELAAGTYYWCRCGTTKHPPFCDGSHRKAAAVDGNGDAVEPLRWKLEEDRRVALCNCKRTASAPLCDGSHSEPLD